MRLIQGIVFDLDGTLIDSMPDLSNALNLTLKAHGRRPVTLGEFRRFYGDGMRMLIQKAFAATGTPFPSWQTEDYFQEYVFQYRNQAPDPSQIYPHVVDVLASLCQTGIKLGICTMKPEEATLWLLDQLGIKQYFVSIAGGDTFPVCKPDKRHILGVIERLGIPAAKCIMVGDGAKDISMAHDACVPCLLVDHDGLAGVETANADGVLHGFKDFKAALEKGGFELGGAAPRDNPSV